MSYCELSWQRLVSVFERFLCGRNLLVFHQLIGLPVWQISFLCYVW